MGPVTPGAWIAAGLAGAGAASVGALALRARRGPPGIPVLRYRLVGPTLPGSAINDQRVPMSALEAQLRHLARRRFDALTLSEALARRHGGSPSRAVALTFDGPWASFGAAVWPALDRAGLVRVTLFFPPDRLGQATLDVGEGRPEPLLSPDALAALAARGVELGVQWGPRPDETTREKVEALRQARARLEEVVGHPVTLLSLPPGPPDASLQRAARRAGFTAAALLGGRGTLDRGTSPWSIPRIVVDRDLQLMQLALSLHRGVE